MQKLVENIPFSVCFSKTIKLSIGERISQGNGNGFSTLASFIWKNTDELWGDFKYTDFSKIILPFTLLRRLECVLEPTREAACAANATYKNPALCLADFSSDNRLFRLQQPRSILLLSWEGRKPPGLCGAFFREW